jgi:hypothetical protein
MILDSEVMRYGVGDEAEDPDVFAHLDLAVAAVGRTTSLLRKYATPSILTGVSLPRLIRSAIAARSTPRSLAAVACDTKS